MAVIVILAVIALIATPIIFNVIDNARTGAIKSSIAGIIDAIELYQVKSNFLDENEDTKVVALMYSNSVLNMCVRGTTSDNLQYLSLDNHLCQLDFKGKPPKMAALSIYQDRYEIEMQYEDYCVKANSASDELSIEKETCQF